MVCQNYSGAVKPSRHSQAMARRALARLLVASIQKQKEQGPRVQRSARSTPTAKR